MKKKSARKAAKRTSGRKSVHPLHRYLPVSHAMAVTILVVGFVILILVARLY